ncbi:TPA: hypothetical protein ACGJ3Y_006373, partial [Pseudomonas aeruginosa]
WRLKSKKPRSGSTRGSFKSKGLGENDCTSASSSNANQIIGVPGFHPSEGHSPSLCCCCRRRRNTHKIIGMSLTGVHNEATSRSSDADKVISMSFLKHGISYALL